MIKAIKKLAESMFYPEDQEGEEKTGFLLGTLTQIEFLQAMSMGVMRAVPSAPNGMVFVANERGINYILLKGLKGWENFTDNDGADMEFKPSNFHTIPADILNDLIGEIIEKSSMTDDLKKSSE